MLNDLLFGRFQLEIENKLVSHIKERANKLGLDSKITITTEPYDGYPDCDELQVIINFNDVHTPDDGFVLTYDLYYGEDQQNKRDADISMQSDILRGTTGNYGGICWPQKEIKFSFNNLNPLDDELTEDVVISGLLLKEYILDSKLQQA